MGKSIEVVEKWVGGLKAASYLINGYRRGGVGRQRRLNKKLNHRLININMSGQHRAFAVVLGKPSFSNNAVFLTLFKPMFKNFVANILLF